MESDAPSQPEFSSWITADLASARPPLASNTITASPGFHPRSVQCLPWCASNGDRMAANENRNRRPQVTAACEKKKHQKKKKNNGAP